MEHKFFYFAPFETKNLTISSLPLYFSIYLHFLDRIAHAYLGLDINAIAMNMSVFCIFMCFRILRKEGSSDIDN